MSVGVVRPDLRRTTLAINNTQPAIHSKGDFDQQPVERPFENWSLIWTAPVLAETERFCNPKRERGIVPNSFPRLRFGLLFRKKWRCPTMIPSGLVLQENDRCRVFEMLEAAGPLWPEHCSVRPLEPLRMFSTC